MASSQCCCGINATLQSRPASVWSPTRDSPTFGSEKSKETEFDQYLKQKRDPSPPIRLPPTTQLFRPEPVFPNEFKRPRLTPPLDEQDHMVRRRRVTDGSAGIGPYFLHQSTEEQRRSAFTRTTTPTVSTSTIATTSPPLLSLPPLSMTTKDDINMTTSTASSSSSSSSSSSLSNTSQQHMIHQPGSIPVIYTPSNKKRKKNPANIMSSNTTSSTTTNNTNPTHTSANTKSSQPQSQQVSTAVRTYYDVDRDANGNYALPVEIDSWTVVDLGTIVYDRPAYHNQRYIYPVNYTVRK